LKGEIRFDVIIMDEMLAPCFIHNTTTHAKQLIAWW
jgi:hypothetical protein